MNKDRILSLPALAVYCVYRMQDYRDPAVTLLPICTEAIEPNAINIQKVWVNLEGYADLLKPLTLWRTLFYGRHQDRRDRFLRDVITPAVGQLHDKLALRAGHQFIPLSIDGVALQVHEVRDPASHIALRVHIHKGWLCIAAAVA